MPNNKLPEIRQKARVNIRDEDKRSLNYSHICILGISPANSQFYGESFFAMLLAIKAAGFKQLRIGLSDTLQRFNFERRGLESAVAYQASKQQGDAWYSEQTFQLGDSEAGYTHQQMIDMVFPKDCGVEVTFERWDELRFESTESATESTSSGPVLSSVKAPPTFAEIEAIVRREYLANKMVNAFADKVEAAAFNLLRDKTGIRTRQEQLPLVIEYILEEITMQVLWGLRYPHSVAPYPLGKGRAIMNLIEEALNVLLDMKLVPLHGSVLYSAKIHIDSKGKPSQSSSRSPSPPSRQEAQSSVPSASLPALESSRESLERADKTDAQELVAGNGDAVAFLGTQRLTPSGESYPFSKPLSPSSSSSSETPLLSPTQDLALSVFKSPILQSTLRKSPSSDTDSMGCDHQSSPREGESNSSTSSLSLSSSSSEDSPSSSPVSPSPLTGGQMTLFSAGGRGKPDATPVPLEPKPDPVVEDLKNLIMVDPDNGHDLLCLYIQSRAARVSRIQRAGTERSADQVTVTQSLHRSYP